MAFELYDNHVHSNLSWDCDTEPRDNVLEAIHRGLAGLTFAEHFDTHPDEWEQCAYDDAAYSATIAALREEFGQQVFIGKGIEVCYQPDNMDFILDFLAGHQFDLVMLPARPGALAGPRPGRGDSPVSGGGAPGRQALPGPAAAARAALLRRPGAPRFREALHPAVLRSGLRR